MIRKRLVALQYAEGTPVHCLQCEEERPVTRLPGEEKGLALHRTSKRECSGCGYQAYIFFVGDKAFLGTGEQALKVASAEEK